EPDGLRGHDRVGHDEAERAAATLRRPPARGAGVRLPRAHAIRGRTAADHRVVPQDRHHRSAGMKWSEATVLVTGGTGSFGQKFTEIMLRDVRPRKLIVLSRDELKQHEMQQRFGDGLVRYFLGDVRDRERLYRAFHGVDVVVHAAALKQVPACEYNPFEAILTNVMGA